MKRLLLGIICLLLIGGCKAASHTNTSLYVEQEIETHKTKAGLKLELKL